MPKVTIQSGETEELIPAAAFGRCIELRVNGGEIAVSPSRPDAANSPRTLSPGWAGDLDVPEDMTVYAHGSGSNDAIVTWYVTGVSGSESAETFGQSGSPVARQLAGNPDGIAHGNQTVSSSGTAEALNSGSSVPVPAGQVVTVKAKPGNAGQVFVGGSGVDSNNGFILAAGEAVSLEVADASAVHIDAANDGDAVRWIVEQ